MFKSTLRHICSSVTQFEVTVEHGFAAHVVFIGDLLSWTVVILQVGTINGSNQRFAQVQLIDLQHINLQL